MSEPPSLKRTHVLSFGERAPQHAPGRHCRLGLKIPGYAPEVPFRDRGRDGRQHPAKVAALKAGEGNGSLASAGLCVSGHETANLSPRTRELVLRNLYVVTHAQSRHHTEGLVGGWYDSELTELGLSQASCIGERIRELVPDDAPAELYSSNLMRARQTAEAIASHIRVPIQITADLREKSYGDAEGQPQAWLDERFVFAPRIGDRMDHRDGIPNAESKREFAGRIYRAMDRILASPCGRQIIVTHGFALTFVVAAWIKMPLDAAGYIAVKSASGGITHLVEDDVYYNRGIVSINETSHLHQVGR